MADRWSVINQEQVIGKQPDNTYGPIMRVTYRTSTNVVRWVEIPINQYTADNVAAAIEAQVEQTDAISNL